MLFPEPERAAIVAANEKFEEKVNFAETLEQAKVLMPRTPDIPVVLLSANPPPAWPVKVQLATRRADLDFVDGVPQGEMRRVNTGHYVQQEAPQLVIDEVQRVIAKTR
jgi:hypothetical protein